MKGRLIVFDVDGTLIDSQHMICAAMAAAFLGEGLSAPERAAILQIVGLSLPQAMARLCEAADIHRVARLCDAYKGAFGALRADAANEEPLYPGARETLDALRDAGAMFGIATGKSRRGVRHLLERHGLSDHFTTVQTADDAPSKPHPAMLAQALAETGVEARHAAMVGDTTFDMEMARNAGMAGIGVAWGYHPPAALTAAGASRVATSFPDLPLALREALVATGTFSAVVR